GPALGTVLGSGAAALAAARLPPLRLVSLESSLSPAEQAVRPSPMDETRPLPSVVRLWPAARPRPDSVQDAASAHSRPPATDLPDGSPTRPSRPSHASGSSRS